MCRIVYVGCNMIPEEKILEIREKTNIVDIISDYIPLEQKGRNYFAVCPFHDDHNPSMSISPAKQIYKCFVCGAHGNVFSFVKDYENISFVEAVKMVANKVSIDLDIRGIVKKEDNKNRSFYDIYDTANKMYQNNLNTASGLDALSYLEKRGITKEIIKEFEIGLALNSTLYKVLNSKNFTDEELINSGICSYKDNKIFDMFLNRIMFPIWDITGKVVGFSGRLYKSDDGPKYINSKESEIFKKGELLYNYHRAKDEAKKKKTIIITEGFMDVIGLYKFGIKNVIATMGTAVTENQSALIKKMARNIVLCFDGDEAGEYATIACAKELITKGILPKIVRLINNLDPDEYINKYGVDKFNEYIDNAKSYINFKIDYYKKYTNFENSDEVSLYIKNIIEELKLENDEIVRELILKNLSDETNISYNTLSGMMKENKDIVRTEKKKTFVTTNKYQKSEMRLIYYMLRSEEVLKLYDRNRCFFPTREYRLLVNELLYFYKKYNSISIADFISFLDNKDELLQALSSIDENELPDEFSMDEIKDYIDVLNGYGVEFEINRLRNEFKSEVDQTRK